MNISKVIEKSIYGGLLVFVANWVTISLITDYSWRACLINLCAAIVGGVVTG